MSKLSVFTPNTHGTDYIVSDIHGYFPLFEEKLKEVDFKPSMDRVFSLGDLIDRGRESHRSLEYLQYPWFHAILGNHEIMLLEAFETDDPEVYRRWYYWGGDWAESLTKKELQTYYDVFIKLPVAIELHLKSQQTVGLVHAELPDSASWKKVRQTLNDIPEICSVKQLYQYGTSGMLWAKTQAYGSEKQNRGVEIVQHIDHVFHGHSIVYSQPLTIANRTFMDLGSYETGELGFINVVDFMRR